MKYYMVYAMTKHVDPVKMDGSTVNIWTPTGVYGALSAEAACQAAARATQRVGNFFAVEGFPWGVELLEPDAVEFAGGEATKLQQLEIRSRELEKDVGLD